MNQTLAFSVTIKDCETQTFRAGGKGGQSQNKTDSGVRVKHAPSGAVGVSREGKSQLQNKRAAFRRMAESPAFQQWARLEVAKRSGDIDARVKTMMRAENILTETYTP